MRILMLAPSAKIKGPIPKIADNLIYALQAHEAVK